MENKPYFCPNCRSNRVKFNQIQKTSQQLFKDAQSGEITEIEEPVVIEEPEPLIECRVCSFQSNEQRFIKQAERFPRVMTETDPAYV